jgi:hypothetical protein
MTTTSPPNKKFYHFFFLDESFLCTAVVFECPKIQNGFWQHAKGKKEIKIHSDILKIRVIEKIEQKRSISKPESINDAQSDN